MSNGITQHQFDDLALRYSHVFHHSFSWRGVRHWQMRVSLYLFVAMLLCYFPYFWAVGRGWQVQGYYLIAVTIFQLMGMFMWLLCWEPVLRGVRVHGAGLLGIGGQYRRKDLALYKTRWLARELGVGPDQYMPLIKALREARELTKQSVKLVKPLGDRLLASFFSLKPLVSVSLVPVFFGLLVTVLRSLFFDFGRFTEQVGSQSGDILSWAKSGVIIFVSAVIVVGFCFNAVVAIRSVVLDLCVKRCSIQSRERLVRELLRRALLV